MAVTDALALTLAAGVGVSGVIYLAYLAISGEGREYKDPR